MSILIDRAIELNPILSPKEELALVKKAKRGDKAAKDRLVSSNLRFLKMSAGKYTGYKHDFDDLLQEASIGLLRAIEKFDPKKNIRFLSYAQWWVRAALERYVVENNSVVKCRAIHRGQSYFYSVRKLVLQYEHANPHMTRSEVVTKLSAQLGLAEDMITTFFTASGVRPDLSLNANTTSDQANQTTFLDLLEGGETPACEAAQKNQEKATLHRAARFVATQPIEKDLMKNRLLSEDPHSLRKIASRHRSKKTGGHPSPERVRQIETALKERLLSVLGA